MYIYSVYISEWKTDNSKTSVFRVSVYIDKCVHIDESKTSVYIHLLLYVIFLSDTLVD